VQIINIYPTTDIAFSPNIIASGQLVFEPLKGLTFSAISKYVGKQYLDNTSNPDRVINSYFVEDLRLTYDFKTKGIKNIGLNFYVNNVLNAQYESNGYTYNYIYGSQLIVSNNYYPQAGTNFLFGLSLKF
jgi:iron complex outermembrane recepter protein